MISLALQPGRAVYGIAYSVSDDQRRNRNPAVFTKQLADFTHDIHLAFCIQ